MEKCCILMKMFNTVPNPSSPKTARLDRSYRSLEEEYELELADPFKSAYVARAKSPDAYWADAFYTEANKKKNRYENIICLDHSRVRLSGSAGSIGSDYIHANYVNGYSWNNKFIATQAPFFIFHSHEQSQVHLSLNITSNKVHLYFSHGDK
uniref:AsIV-cont00099-ORF1 n=1 Tax=Apophua simplicipes ichnovirus TaxID=1329648 RepID=S5DRB1_9VIRU|nr:AsIV-cont00099-ORF1 [Apophua simplicipes ichnovirus]